MFPKKKIRTRNPRGVLRLCTIHQYIYGFGRLTSFLTESIDWSYKKSLKSKLIKS